MNEQNEQPQTVVAPSAEQQPAQQTVSTTPEQQSSPAPIEPGNDLPAGQPDTGAPATPADLPAVQPDGAEPGEPSDAGDVPPASHDGDVTEPHPYVPGFGVVGKFADNADDAANVGAQDDGGAA